MGIYFSSYALANTKADLQTKIVLLTGKIESQRKLADQHLSLAKAYKQKGDKGNTFLHLRLRNSTVKRREQLLKIKATVIAIKENIEMGEIMKDIAGSMKEALIVMRNMTKGQNIGDINEMIGEISRLGEDLEDLGDSLGESTYTDDIETEYENLERQLLFEEIEALKTPEDDVFKETKTPKLAVFSQ